MIIIIWILCVYIPTSAFIMINANFDQKTIDLAGSMDEIGTECAIILRQILKQNKQSWGNLGAQGVLVNIFMLALTGQTDELETNINWKAKSDMFKKQENIERIEDVLKNGFLVDENGNKIKMEHFEAGDIDKLAQVPNINPLDSEQIKTILGSES